MSLRAKLKDIETYCYTQMVNTVGYVRDNYMMVIARKEKEIAALQAELVAANERLTGWRTGVTQLASNTESRLKANMHTLIDAEIADAHSSHEYYDPETVAHLLTNISRAGKI